MPSGLINLGEIQKSLVCLKQLRRTGCGRKPLHSVSERDSGCSASIFHNFSFVSKEGLSTLLVVTDRQKSQVCWERSRTHLPAAEEGFVNACDQRMIRPQTRNCISLYAGCQVEIAHSKPRRDHSQSGDRLGARRH